MSQCKIVDLASSAVPILDRLLTNGVSTVFRYYASAFQSAIPEKRLTPDERDAVLGSGLSLGVVYQFNNSVLSNFNSAKGGNDARFSLQYATRVINQPAGTAIFFGVDGDWPAPEQQAMICRYFEAISEVFSSGPYKVGVYGSGKTCRTLANAKLAELFWLPTPSGWSGTREFYNSSDWHFYQNFQNLQINDRHVDTSFANRGVTNIGTFDRNGAVTDLRQPEAILNARRFVRSVGTMLRSGPGNSYSAIRSLSVQRTVQVLGESNGWVLVDIDEDEQPDGYCEVSRLASVDRMP